LTVTADQIGKLYDILIATRDGSTLPCVDHNGQTRQVSQVAYMLSTTKPSTESTEIARKDQLTQYSSAQQTDRDFDAYPQVEQGDWSDGQGQRVFSGQGEALGTISNKSTRYWDGLGLLWPVTDYLPQQPVIANPDQAEAGAIMKLAGNGVSGGQFSPATNGSGFVYMYMQNAAPQHNIIVRQDATVTTKLDPAPGSTNGTPFVSCDYVVAACAVWYAYDSGALIQIANLFPTANLATIANASMNGNNCQGRIAVGLVAGRLYFAITYTPTAGAFTGNAVMQVFDITTGAFTNFSGQILLGENANFHGCPQQIEFQGDNILISIGTGAPSNSRAGSWSGGAEAALVQYNIPSQTLTTLASFKNVNRLWFRPIAGGVFILAANEAATLGFPNTLDMYLLQGGQLQHIGPVQVQATAQSASNVITGTAEPVEMGPYAVFPVYYFPVNSVTGTHVVVFAYDVLRGRLFKLLDLGGYNQFLGNTHGARFGIAPSITRPVGALTLAAQYDLIVPTLSTSGGATDITNAQELLIGVSNGTFQPFLQTGVQITSSLIDFTSAQNKLYRQIVADFTPLPNDAAITVQLDCWFDQDPANLATVPDFTTGVIAGGGSNTGLQQVKLVTNKIARKVVYRITTTGPSVTPTPAVKVISVKTQVATGWSLHYFLDIARNAVCNDGQTYCFDNQRPVDDFSAHAFLKQLWRLKGGECVATLPTGETYNAIMQLISAENVKHVIQSSLSDTPVVKSVLLEVRIREDV
jgi:hypothetical protein